MSIPLKELNELKEEDDDDAIVRQGFASQDDAKETMVWCTPKRSDHIRLVQICCRLLGLSVGGGGRPSAAFANGGMTQFRQEKFF
jgi:hypothetical protein